MSEFNPDRAILVDETDDIGDEIDGLLGRIDAKAQSLRTKVIADLFREFDKLVKQERETILAEAMKDCRTTIEALNAAVTKISESVTASGAKAGDVQGDVLAKTETLALGQIRLEKMLRAMDARDAAKPDIVPGTAQMVSDAVSQALAGLKNDIVLLAEKQNGDDLATRQGMLDAIQAVKRVEPMKRSGWNFKVERDERARITNVVATPAD